MNKKELARTVVIEFVKRYSRKTIKTLDGLYPMKNYHVCEYDSFGPKYYQWLTIAYAGVGLYDVDNNYVTNKIRINSFCMDMMNDIFPIIDGYPRQWVDTPMGALWISALLWSTGDKLVEIDKVSEMTGIKKGLIRTAIRNGTIVAYKDPQKPYSYEKNFVALSDFDSDISTLNEMNNANE